MSASAWHVEVDPVFGCWLWSGKTNSAGYGLIWNGRKPQSAHKVVYEAEIGPVPEGMVLEHGCKRRACCNPLHIEPVTQRENLMRRSWAYLCRRKVCARGHSMHGALVTPEMGRLCRTCHVEAKGCLGPR